MATTTLARIADLLSNPSTYEKGKKLLKKRSKRKVKRGKLFR